MHFSMEDPKLIPTNFYRAFLQQPDGLSWGPDGRMDIADPAGRHIVRISQDGNFLYILGSGSIDKVPLR